MKKPVKNGTTIQINREQQALKESEERFSLIFENSPVGESMTGIDGSLRVNKAFCDILGYSEKEIKNKNWTEITHPDDIQESRVVVNNLLEGKKQSIRYEKRYLHKKGNVVWTDVSTSLQKDKNGNPLYFTTIIIDITDRKQAEEALKEANENLEIKVRERTEELQISQQRLFLHFQQTPLAVVEFSVEGNITDWNPAAEKVFGYTNKEAIGKFWTFIAPQHFLAFLDGVWESLISQKGGSRSSNENVTKDGKIIMCEWFNTPLINHNGDTIGVASLVMDITERVQAEEEVKNHRDHLEEMVRERTRELDNAIKNLTRSNQELEQFAYVASHDLQEPLRMVSSYTQLLERRYKDKLDQDATDFINYAVDGANRMQRLINDLLEYSRVTTKGKPLIKIDLTSVLGQAIANLHNKIQETGSMIVNDDLPFAYGDEGQLVRVFQNLLDNAIKFRREESPRINVTSKIIEDKVQISIADNGIGIDTIYNERVFTIFQRLHTKANYPGTGIGLAICKRTIERHGGTIWFESEPGKGSTFCFTLNIK